MVKFFINFDYKMSIRIYEVKSVLNVLYVTKFVTSSFAVFEPALRVKSTHLTKSCLKTIKKEKCGNKRDFDINLHLKGYAFDLNSGADSTGYEGHVLPTFTNGWAREAP